MENARSRIWKLKGQKRDDDREYIAGSIIAIVAIVAGRSYHVGF